jgi:uracil-DNA glycosylase family 4
MNDEQILDEAQMARALLQQLESLQAAGVTNLPKGRVRDRAPAPAPVVAAAVAESRPASVAARPNPTPVPTTAAEPPLFGNPAETPVIPAAERPALLEVIRRQVAGCTRCAELAETRTQTVFGVGDPNARLMFIGEAPGADEDRQGEPFVGRAGQLLTKIIEACKLKREQVYIANVLKCRPPGNRTPLPDEVQNCRGYLERQIAIIRPEFICCLGAVAAQSLLSTEITIGKLRGRFHQFQGIPVICTYHPSYLLRNPAAKHDTWADMKTLMLRMGVEL